MRANKQKCEVAEKPRKLVKSSLPVAPIDFNRLFSSLNVFMVMLI